MSNCNGHKENIRDGSGRLTRYLKALDPSYAPIDNRSLEELLVFIQKYAARIRFYDIPESKIEDSVPPEKVSWENFFKKDMAVIAASIGVTDTEVIKKEYDKIRDELDVSPGADKLAKLFTASIALATKINDWYALAIPANPLHSDLKMAINSNLAKQLQRIMAYEEGYRLINTKKPFRLDYGKLSNNELWGTDQPTHADSSIYDGGTSEEKILNAALYADEIVNNFLTEIKNITNKSDGYLQFVLEQYPAHQPHMALFIAFLKLFQLAQQQMNGLTGRMLDYYYKDVLQLTAKEALPDKAHVVFELAKNVAEYDLDSNTLLKAGKDADGVDQVYATDDNLVINQAKVKEIKTVFIEKDETLKDNPEEIEGNVEVRGGHETIQTIYANPIANSADGNGKPFEEEKDIKWETFGGGKKSNVSNSSICEELDLINGVNIERNYAMPGFAIASPQLVLGGGNRLITLKSEGIQELISQLISSESANPLTIWLSGEKGWLKINRKASEDELNKIMKEGIFNQPIEIEEPVYGFISISDYEMMVIFLPISSDAIVAYDAALHEGYHYPISQPVMQIMLNPDFNLSDTLFNTISLKALSIQVKVGSINTNESGVQMDGLKSLILQNDQQVLPVGKAINPFTLFPGEGKSFYIGSEEIFNKPINELSINIRNTNENNSRSWKVKLYILKNKQWIVLEPNQLNSDNYFSKISLSKGIFKDYEYPDKPEEWDKIKKILKDRNPIVKLTDWNAKTNKGFIRLDYHTDSGGDFSPQELASRLEIKEVAISYSSDLEALEEGIDHFFHVYPFGVVEIGLNDSIPNGDELSGNENPTPITGESDMAPQTGGFHPGIKAMSASNKVNAGNKLLPQFTFTGIYGSNFGQDAVNVDRIAERGETRTLRSFNRLAQSSSGRNNINQYSGHIQEEGILFIGLENAKPLQSVSMLFQFAEGSAGDEDNDPPQIHWSYLSHNQWKPLPGEKLISDGTYGFQTTGIIKVSMPKDATHKNTIITSGLHWIRASVTEHANRIPMLIDIVTQAVLATFNDNNNSPEHYAQALAAASISKLKTPVSQIGKVLQPFASFDGKPKEVGKEFYTRVSERLRHKQRAVTAWDYEHLILDRFPSVYKVKCITHTDPNCLCRKKINENNTDRQSDHCCGPQIAPGHVLLVPVANLKNRNGVDPLQPKTARRVLIEMVDYIKNLTSPFVKVYAKNPVYEQIIVAFQVEFIAGTDVGFHLKKLNDEIVAYLTPWAFDPEAKIVFGQKVYTSSIINFIEERSYVDFITDFKMGVCKEDCCSSNDNDNNRNDGSAKEGINNLSNCDDIERLLSADANEKTGEIVAKPSTSRSILVSAPHHIIKSYESPPVLSPCEQRQSERTTQVITDVQHGVLNPPPIKREESSLEIESKKPAVTGKTKNTIKESRTEDGKNVPPLVSKEKQKDNLKILKGIGPKIEGLLNNTGINTFEDLATTPVNKIRTILQEGGIRSQLHDSHKWPEQAVKARVEKKDKLKNQQGKSEE